MLKNIKGASSVLEIRNKNYNDFMNLDTLFTGPILLISSVLNNFGQGLKNSGFLFSYELNVKS